MKRRFLSSIEEQSLQTLKKKKISLLFFFERREEKKNPKRLAYSLGRWVEGKLPTRHQTGKRRAKKKALPCWIRVYVGLPAARLIFFFGTSSLVCISLSLQRINFLIPLWFSLISLSLLFPTYLEMFVSFPSRVRTFLDFLSADDLDAFRVSPIHKFLSCFRQRI